MEICINNKNYRVKPSFRAMIIFEKLAGRSFTGTGIEDIIIYFYSSIMAADKDCELDYDVFLDWLDSNPEKLPEFGMWFSDNLKRNKFLKGKEDEKGGEEIDPKKD